MGASQIVTRFITGDKKLNVGKPTIQEDFNVFLQFCYFNRDG